VSKPIDTVAELASAFGGVRQMAKLLGLDEATIYGYIAADKIPVKHARKLSANLPQEFEMPYRLFYEK
jgi:predicted DNA-binding transcriptional regulator AlpA